MSDTLPADLRSLLTQIAVQLGRIDERLGHIETDVTDLKIDAREFRQQTADNFAGIRRETAEQFTTVREDIAFIRGQITNIPNMWQTYVIVWSTLVGVPVLITIGIFLLRFWKLIP
jgi:hypothetical protein